MTARLRQDSTIWDESDIFEASGDAGSAQPPGGVAAWCWLVRTSIVAFGLEMGVA